MVPKVFEPLKFFCNCSLCLNAECLNSFIILRERERGREGAEGRVREMGGGGGG